MSFPVLTPANLEEDLAEIMFLGPSQCFLPPKIKTWISVLKNIKIRNEGGGEVPPTKPNPISSYPP